MPRLPTRSADIQPGAISGGRRAGAEDTNFVDMAPVGRAMQGSAELLMQGQETRAKEAERLQRIAEAQAERDANINNASVVAKGRNEWLTWLDNAAQKPMAEAPDVVAQFTKEFEDFKDKAVVGQQHPMGRRQLEIDLDNMRAGLIDNAMRLQSSRAGAAAQSAVKTVFDQNAIAVQKDPNQLEALMVQEQNLMAGLNLTGLTEAQRQRLSEERRHVLPGMALGARIASISDSRGAKALKSELETNNRWQQLLSGEQYGRALNALNTDIRQYENAERQQRAAVVSERIAERAAGVENGLSVREAGGDAKLAAAIKSADSIGRARVEVRSMPYADLTKKMQEAQAAIAQPGNFKGDAAYMEALQSAARERDRALKEDPASYAVQNSNPARKAFDAMVQSNFAPEAVRRYSTVATEAQRDLGGPGHTPRLLPKSLIDQTVADVASLAPEQAANKMESLQKQFGPMWAEVLGEMHGKIAPGYATIGRLTAPSDARTRTELANALKAGPDLRKNILDTDAKDIDAKVEQALQPYARILSQAGPGAQAVLREEFAAAKALAYQSVAKGESPAAAAKRATAALVFDRYDAGATFLAPKGEIGAAQREAARIMQNTPASAFVPAAGGDAALSDTYRRDANRREAMRGFWANVTDQSTSRLGIEWRNSDGTPVTLDSGERVRLYFDDLKNLPPQATRGALPAGVNTTPGGAAVRAR
jgi:hypothetical protein